MRPRRRAGRPLLALAGAAAAAMVVFLAGAQAATGSVCSTGTLAAVDCAHITPVPSLEPGATELEWAALVQAQRQRGGVAELAAAEDCRPVRTIFYAASDWLRLATKLASGGSPCAQYYISIPPLTADKTRPRVPIRRGASGRSALASTPWRRSTSPRGRSGSARTALRGTPLASRPGVAWLQQATTPALATHGR